MYDRSETTSKYCNEKLYIPGSFVSQSSNQGECTHKFEKSNDMVVVKACQSLAASNCLGNNNCQLVDPEENFNFHLKYISCGTSYKGMSFK